MLHLGPGAAIPVYEGLYNVRISSDVSGVELRKDQSFISSCPIPVFKHNPHPQLLRALSAKQKVFSRCDAVGYVPKLNSLYNSGYALSADGADYDNYFEDCDPDQQVILPDSQMKCYVRDCMYLGADIDWTIPLKLKEVIKHELYAVHNLATHTLLGYLFTVGISGCDLNSFHCNNGFDEVAILLPVDDGKSNFIAFLGKQDSLTRCEVNELNDNIDWDHLDPDSALHTGCYPVN